MIFLKRLFDPFQLANAAATIYTTPVNMQVQIKKLTFTNTSANARTVSLYIVKGGGAHSTADLLWDAVVVPAHSVRECFEAEGHVLEGSNAAGAADFIDAFADVAAVVTAMGSGIVVTP